MIDDLLFLYHWYCSINMKYLQNLLCRFGDADVSQLRHQIDCVAGRVATKALIVIFRERKGWRFVVVKRTLCFPVVYLQSKPPSDFFNVYGLTDLLKVDQMLSSLRSEGKGKRPYLPSCHCFCIVLSNDLTLVEGTRKRAYPDFVLHTTAGKQNHRRRRDFPQVWPQQDRQSNPLQPVRQGCSRCNSKDEKEHSFKVLFA